MKPDDHNYDAWEHYKEVLHEGLKELLSENMTVNVSIGTEMYSEAHRVLVQIEYDGEVIAEMADSITIPPECKCSCGGCNG